MTLQEQIDNPYHNRPHVVLLGAGASRVAFPKGDKNGKLLPLMSDFTDIVPIGAHLDKCGIEWKGKNFEEVYNDITSMKGLEKERECIEQIVFDYFSDMEIPDEATLYDHLILSLRSKDVIATFNWDPFLIQAIVRIRRRIKINPPILLFLHGNVALGVCLNDMIQGPRGSICRKCGNPFNASKILYPIKEKDYENNLQIKYAWDDVKKAFGLAAFVTIFGYSAPSSDHSAMKLLKEGWGDAEKKRFVAFEIIDVRSKEIIRNSWEGFIYDHYDIYDNFYESWLPNHPRRSIETIIKQNIEGDWDVERNPIGDIRDLLVLKQRLEPLINAES